MRRIVCVGNRYEPRDAAGPAVYDRLAARGIHDGFDLIDGGIAGLDLLHILDDAERVVFVDTVSGFGEPGEVLTINPSEVELPARGIYGHGSGLAYLLEVAPLACEGDLPEIVIIGIEGSAGAESIDEAADRAVAAVTG